MAPSPPKWARACWKMDGMVGDFVPIGIKEVVDVAVCFFRTGVFEESTAAHVAGAKFFITTVA
eukprot:6389039-Prymnesium_polylepis.1